MHSLAPHLDQLASQLTLALHISAVQQPPPNIEASALSPLIGDALADLGDWGIRAPMLDQLELINRAVQAMQPCMPD
ncbi:hypothetical protein ACF07Y_42985 [Streptomyces sp. NPDC016566]|uniref:hypothetical protein n=1 Tax=Streptomyces sp. NPDC016566 TaxID=3364967 RepID=UPI0037006EBD